MDNDIIYSDILNLEKDILHIEETLVEFLNLKYEKGIKKSLHQLESNLRYLSILANGAPINKNEDRKIMDFLRIHYDYLQKLLLSRDNLKDFHEKLKNYRYVDDLTDIQYGRYIRWINLKDPNKISLTRGGIIIDIKILSNGIHLVCKNTYNHKFQIKIDECYIFQKLTEQEQILLMALDYLDKSK